MQNFNQIYKIKNSGKTDIIHFFNTINKQILLEQVLKALPDNSIDGLIREIIFNDIDSLSKSD